MSRTRTETMLKTDMKQEALELVQLMNELGPDGEMIMFGFIQGAKLFMGGEKSLKRRRNEREKQPHQLSLKDFAV